MRNRHQLSTELAAILELGNEFGSWEARDPLEALPLRFDNLLRETERKIARETGYDDEVANSGAMYGPRSEAYLDLKASVERKALSRSLESTSNRFRLLIYGKDNENELTDIDVHNATLRYREFLRQHDILSRVLKYREANRHNKTSPSFEIPDAPIGRIVLDENRKLRFELLPDEAISGLEIDKIGVCAFCRRVFVSIRSTAKYCSKQCGLSFRQQKWQRDPENRAKDLAMRKKKYQFRRILAKLQSETEKLERLERLLGPESKNRLIEEQREIVGLVQLELNTVEVEIGMLGSLRRGPSQV